MYADAAGVRTCSLDHRSMLVTLPVVGNHKYLPRVTGYQVQATSYKVHAARAGGREVSRRVAPAVSRLIAEHDELAPQRRDLYTCTQACVCLHAGLRLPTRRLAPRYA